MGVMPKVRKDAHFVVEFSERSTHGYNHNRSCDVVCATALRALQLVLAEHPAANVHVVRRVGSFSNDLIVDDE